MDRLDYSNFGRFCHCAYRGLSDISSSDYLLGKHCRYMCYSQMVAFYRRFKDAAQYVYDLDSFVYHLKWFDQDPQADLVREAVLADIFGSGRMIKAECIDDLHSRYRADINEFISDFMVHESESDSLCDDQLNDQLPF